MGSIIWNIDAIKYEAAYDEFLESKEYDEADEAIFQLTRKAFAAGWLAAGGDEAALPPKRNLFVVDNDDEKPERTE